MTMADRSPDLTGIIRALEVRIRKMEQAGFQPPSVTADPTVLTDGMFWFRSDLGQYRGRVSGVTKTFTVT